ncbi:sensor histidine kinase [Arthrobacter rhombi]|uniref:sensor histidine kinase n=1 Tax=Arthrobacter rhombi TaxID=71253 RepID=UPI0031DA008A
MSRMGGPGPAPSQPVDGWARCGWLLSAIWLVFLGYTIATLFVSDLGVPRLALGLFLVLLFAGVYLAGFIFGNRLNAEARWVRWNPLGLAALVAIILGMSTLIGLGCLFMTPFIIAYACFLLPRLWAWIVGIGTIVLTLALTALAGHVAGYLFIVAIQMGIFVLNMVTFALIQAGERSEKMQSDLALVSERERVARDVHDVLGHTLTVVAVKAELAERLIDGDPERSRTEIAEIRALVRGALADVRATVGGLRGNDLSTQLAALRVTLDGAGVAVDVEGEHAGQVPDRLRDPLGWLVREAGTNVLRHARATRCVIRFSPGSLVIEDDGVGLGGSTAGNGMCGMSERMAEAGASFHVGAASLGGARVEAAW